MAADQAVSVNIEEYLEWIYRLSKEQPRVTATDLARSLKISPASVTGMLKRLVDQGLIHHQPYGGITLTDEGAKVGARIVRRHGLLERLLCDVVGVPWSRVDDVVGHLEHYLNDEVEDRLAAFLNYPTTCPHGQPIDWNEAATSVRLIELEPGQAGTVARIGDESLEFLEYIEALGMVPGAPVQVMGREPFGGPLRVKVAGSDHSLGDETVRNIWVEREAAV